MLSDLSGESAKNNFGDKTDKRISLRSAKVPRQFFFLQKNLRVDGRTGRIDAVRFVWTPTGENENGTHLLQIGRSFVFRPLTFAAFDRRHPLVFVQTRVVRQLCNRDNALINDTTVSPTRQSRNRHRANVKIHTENVWNPPRSTYRTWTADNSRGRWLPPSRSTRDTIPARDTFPERTPTGTKDNSPGCSARWSCRAGVPRSCPATSSRHTDLSVCTLQTGFWNQWSRRLNTD